MLGRFTPELADPSDVVEYVEEQLHEGDDAGRSNALRRGGGRWLDRSHTARSPAGLSARQALGQSVCVEWLENLEPDARVSPEVIHAARSVIAGEAAATPERLQYLETLSESLSSIEVDAKTDERLVSACASADPATSLVRLVETLRSEGVDQKRVRALLDRARLRHEDDAEDTVHMVIVDTLDRVLGYCAPPLRLFPRDE